MKNNIKEDYNPQNLPKSSVQVIKSLKVNINAAIEGCEGEIDYLKSALAQYKSSINKNIDTNLENTDIMLKYTNKSTGGTYNLPAVFSNLASYSIEEAKADSQRLEQLQSELKNSESERNLYFAIVERNIRDLNKRLQNLVRYSNDLSAYLEEMKEYENSTMRSNKNNGY